MELSTIVEESFPCMVSTVRQGFPLQMKQEVNGFWQAETAVPKDVNLTACVSELFRGAAHQLKKLYPVRYCLLFIIIMIIIIFL